MPTMCNACGAIYELWSEAIECHPDVVDVSEEQYAEYKAAQQQRVPDECHVCGAKFPALSNYCVVCGTRR